MSERPVPASQFWWLAAGFTIWCSALVMLYAIHGVGCAFAWSSGSLRLWLVVALLAHLGVLGWMWWNVGRFGSQSGSDPTQAFLRWAVIGTLIAALVATITAFGPPLLLATCV